MILLLLLHFYKYTAFNCTLICRYQVGCFPTSSIVRRNSWQNILLRKNCNA
nr:MAG TPA: hypothetical protein [Caudoviricetes sp.]